MPAPERAKERSGTQLSLYVIYDHPTDYPDSFVVRRWEGLRPREVVAITKTIEAARKLLTDTMPDLTRLARSDQDDPKIVEVWL
jgi:hypothetical protein